MIAKIVLDIILLTFILTHIKFACCPNEWLEKAGMYVMYFVLTKFKAEKPTTSISNCDAVVVVV